MNTLAHQDFNTKVVTSLLGLEEPDYKNMDTEEYKILVVEDEPISQRVVQLALENMGYQVVIAATGSEALALFKATNYNVVLMDYGLPDITGVDVARKFRELEKDKDKQTPVIALTAHGDFAKAECLAAGMNDFISKPIELEKLNQLIQSWVKK